MLERQLSVQFKATTFNFQKTLWYDGVLFFNFTNLISKGKKTGRKEKQQIWWSWLKWKWINFLHTIDTFINDDTLIQKSYLSSIEICDKNLAVQSAHQLVPSNEKLLISYGQNLRITLVPLYREWKDAKQIARWKLVHFITKLYRVYVVHAGR